MRQGTMAAIAAALTIASAGALGASGGPQLTDTPDGGTVWPTACGQGVLTECGSVTTRTCTSWKTTYGVSASMTGGGFTATSQCEQWVEKTQKLYKDILLMVPG